jgi:lysophospholipase L1-like esterase
MKWVSSWKYIPILYDMEMAAMENCTQRVIFPNNLNGNKVRILLSNKWSKKPLIIEKMTVGTTEDDTVTEFATVTLKGEAVIKLAPDEEVLSDEINLQVYAGKQIAVSAYIKERQVIENACCFWAKGGAKVLLNDSGDDTETPIFNPVWAGKHYTIMGEDDGSDKEQYFYGFSAVQVYTEDDVHLIAAFGDSITHMAYVTNEITKRLYQSYPGKVALINCGIAGNRLVSDATYMDDLPANGGLFGEAGVKRFEKDVYEIDSVDLGLVLEGINDIMHPVQFDNALKATSAEEIIEGFKQIIEIAHKHGSLIYGCTVMPVGNDEYSKRWMEAFEESRLPLNEWMRTKNCFDGVLDYDLMVRDENKPGYMREGFSLGDGLHPGYVGAKCIAEQIDYAMLMK